MLVVSQKTLLKVEICLPLLPKKLKTLLLTEIGNNKDSNDKIPTLVDTG